MVVAGLAKPTAFDFTPDGRLFVAEQRGVIKVFDDLSDTTPTVFADLRANVHHFWDRGLLGLVADRAFPDRPFPDRPYLYILYDYDAPVGGQAPVWGTPGGDSDSCHPDSARAHRGRLRRQRGCPACGSRTARSPRRRCS
jgi:hypothetical protein